MLMALLVGLMSINAFGQAKKPRLVVIPADALMQQMNLLGETDDMGETNYVQNYKKAFLDSDFKGCIAKISEMFADRGFPLTMLEAELRRVQGTTMTINVDLRLELNYKINKQGPRDILYFELTAIDAFSSKQVAGSSGQSKPAIGETKVNLLQEAVIDKIDKFVQDIDEYFNSLVEIGRESRLKVEANGIELPEEVEDLVDEWMNANCVRGSFTIDNVDETQLIASQAMMPLFDEAGKAVDAYNFYRNLAKDLQAKLPSFKFRAKRSSATSSSGGSTLGDGYIEVTEAE